MSETSQGRRGFMKLAAGSALLAPALARTASAQAAQSAPAPAAGYPKRPEKKKALFVYGGWPGHEPTKCRTSSSRGCAPTASRSRSPTRRRLTPTPHSMSTIDLVTQVWTMGTIEKEPLKGLLAAVKNGTGMAGWHGGMGDAYRQETEYRYMVGGDWVATRAASSTTRCR